MPSLFGQAPDCQGADQPHLPSSCTFLDASAVSTADARRTRCDASQDCHRQANPPRQSSSPGQPARARPHHRYTIHRRAIPIRSLRLHSTCSCICALRACLFPFILFSLFIRPHLRLRLLWLHPPVSTWPVHHPPPLNLLFSSLSTSFGFLWQRHTPLFFFFPSLQPASPSRNAPFLH